MRHPPHLVLLVGLAASSCAVELPSELGDCPDDSVVAWADAGPIFAEHCTRCHSSDLEGEDRNNAPLMIDFDEPETAIRVADLAWVQIWTGAMPKDADPIPDDQAEVLWEWLSCDGPE